MDLWRMLAVIYRSHPLAIPDLVQLVTYSLKQWQIGLWGPITAGASRDIGVKWQICRSGEMVDAPVSKTGRGDPVSVRL